MSEFLYLYRGGNFANNPEEMQKTMQKWMGWFKDLGEKGNLKDAGHPLDRGGKVVRGTQKPVTDGPFAEAKDVVGGYSIVIAKDLAHATELSFSCPIFDNGGFVEVRPVMAM
jgi:hypothetical protein